MNKWRREKTCGRIPSPPRKFLVGNRTYSLDFVPTNNDFWGRTMYQDRRILLDETMPPRFMAEILVHEVFHAIHADHYGPLPAAKAEIEEVFVNQLSTGIVKVFRDNPKLFAWWLYLMCVEEDK